MTSIIIDLEATCWDGMPLADQQETIELAAIKVNGYGEILDHFVSFVKPVLGSRLSVYCKNLTGIQQSDVDQAPEFGEVMGEFYQWTRDPVEILGAWGKEDLRILKDDCALHGIDEDQLHLKQYVDLKSAYRRLKRRQGRFGLRQIVELELGEFVGEQHRALPDAQNLALLFQKYIGEWNS